MTSKFIHTLRASGLAIAAALAASPVLAQEQTSAGAAAPAAEDNAASGDIVVTAQFREQRLQDTPLAITAVNAATLEARSQTSIVDVGQFAPNVNLTQATAINANSIAAFIRGIGQEDASFALEPGVGIYLDDVYYGTTFGAVFDLTDLDRVEVLRGPQGTLAGKNSLGGAVKMFTRKPDANSDGFVEATYGRFDRIDVRASAGFTIADGLYARFSGVEKHRDGFFKLLDYGCVNPGQGIAATRPAGKCRIGTQGGIDVLALRGALRYAPDGSPLEINIAADISRDRSQPVATKLTYASNPNVRSYTPGNPFAGVPFDSRFLTGPHSYTSYADYGDSGNFTVLGLFPYQVAPGVFPDPGKNSANGWGVVGTIDYQLSDSLSFKSITAYRHARGTSVVDIDGSPLDEIKERFTNRHNQFTQEVRLNGKVGSFADFTVGGFYYKADDLIDDRIQIPIFFYDFETQDPVKTRSIAGFAHLELHPTEKLNIIGGLRYTDDRKSYRFSRLNYDGSPIGTIFPLGPSGPPLNFLQIGLDGLSSTFEGNRWDYRLGANYHWTDSLMTYAQVSTGFKGGGVNPQPFTAAQAQPFGPEKLTTWEGGFKSEFLDRAVRLNGALFYNEYKDIQRKLFSCADGPCSQTVNAGDGHSYGAELEAYLRPAPGLTIDGSAGYLKFKYDRINPATGITLAMNAPFVSKWTGSAGIQYVADFGGGSLTPRLDWSYHSSFFYQAVNAPLNRIPGRSLFNARLTWESRDGGWSLSGSVTNLFDKFYYVGSSENVNSFGVSSNVVGRPREWAITVKKKF
jgi:iron complex outermembrane receptor protein